MTEHPYGWYSLLPPIVAIVLAIATRHVVVSLLIGIYVGALVIARGSQIAAVPIALEGQLWQSLVDESHLRVLVFTALMGAMVGVVYRAGGMHGIVQALAPLARSRRGGQLLTWVLGLIIFFDDYANTLLLGGTMRPLADRLKISREKLAYLVDSTAAPVAGLAVISTWVAGEIGYIAEGYQQLNIDNVNAFDVFVQTIPYRYYVLLSLLLVPLIGLLGRDFGPMLTAERKRVAEGDEPLEAACSEKETDAEDPRSGDRSYRRPTVAVTPRWYNAAVPVLPMIGVTIWLLLATGEAKIMSNAAQADAGAAAPSPTWVEMFREGDSYLALVYGSLAGWVCAWLLAAAQRLLPMGELAFASGEGVRQILPALAILWMAWSLSKVTTEVQTGEYLGGLLQQGVPVFLMPTVIFLLASAISFATGTSWGTMGILTPLVVSVTYKMLTEQTPAASPTDPIMIAAIGSVLAGAIFGDHCSPISDTTVLSSLATGCDHVAHVWTQMPYALVAAGVSIVCGTLPVGLGMSVWWTFPLGAAALILILLFCGGRVEQGSPAPGKS